MQENGAGALCWRCLKTRSRPGECGHRRPQGVWVTRELTDEAPLGLGGGTSGQGGSPGCQRGVHGWCVSPCVAREGWSACPGGSGGVETTQGQ